MSQQPQSSSSSFKPNSDFFQIPILTHLLHNYYSIPAPVIYPPGSDPPSFPNPNPHRHQASMDVDPCLVASMREIVAQKVDLSASEHAGVTLSKAAPMVSTTSNYPTNSADVAPQTLNDLVSIVETKNTNSIVCEVCNVICDSEKSFKNHVHLKKTQKPIVSSTINQLKLSPVANDMLHQESKKKKNQDLVSTAIDQLETPSSVANDSLNQESEKNNQDLLQKEAVDESLFICDIPEPGQHYPKIATVEVDESLFKHLVTSPTSRTSVGRTPVQGSKHRKILKISETTPITEPMEEESKSIQSESGDLQHCKTTWCEVCKVHCARNAYNIHASGKKHVKNLQRLQRIPKLPSTIIDSVTVPLAEKLKLMKGEVVNPNEANSASCELCGVYFTSTVMLNSHISGKRHQKNLKKSEKHHVPSPAPVAKKPLLEPMDEEGEVVFLEMSKRKANDQSLVSKEDADAKRQKINELERCGVWVTCKVCNVSCNGLMALKAHLAGFEHSAMALKQAKDGSNGLQI